MTVALTTTGGPPSSRWDLLGHVADLPLRPHETASAEPVWVLSVVVAGRVWRWATQDCAPVMADGETVLLIPGGAKLAVEEQADVARLDGSEMSVSVRGLLPPEDIAALVEAGHAFDDVPAEVALWYSGRSWEERHVVLRGSTWLPEYGTREEGIALTVESPEYEEHGRLIEVSGTITSLPGTKPGEKVDGRIYPLVIGRPDWVPATIYDEVQERAVIAQGQVAATEVATVVHDQNSTVVTSEAGVVVERRDNLGKWVSTVDYTGFATFVSNDVEVITRWIDGFANGGGIMDDHGGSHVTGLGDVVRWAMRRSTIPIDEGRWRAVEDYLNQWLIDFWTNDPELTPWQFVRDHLLPLVPVSILHGPRGLYPVWWPYDASPQGATGGAHRRVAEVNVQASGLERVGRVQFERSEQPVNEVSLEYYPWQGDLWRYRLTYSGAPRTAAESTDTFWASTAPLRSAYVRHNEERRVAKLVQSRCVYLRVTAEQTLNWWQYDKCRSKRVVTYDDARHRWGWLRPGHVVQLVDEELGIDRLAWVRRRAISVGAARLQFLLWDHT